MRYDVLSVVLIAATTAALAAAAPKEDKYQPAETTTTTTATTTPGETPVRPEKKQKKPSSSSSTEHQQKETISSSSIPTASTVQKEQTKPPDENATKYDDTETTKKKTKKKEKDAKKTQTKFGRWRERRVLVLYRGVHFGSYTGRGRAVTVDANADSVIANHEAQLLGPLRNAGANVTVAACSYKSPVSATWLERSRATIAVLLDAKNTKGKPRTPNDLIIEAYSLALKVDAFDTLISVRADILFKKPLVSAAAAVPFDRLGFAWKEANGLMSKRCWYRAGVDADNDKASSNDRKSAASCYAKWLKNGERFADAVLVAPRRAIGDLRFAVAQAVKIKVVWDQHSMFQHLKKQKGYTVKDNVSTMVPGYWNSNPNAHGNPLFTLARKKHMASSRARSRSHHHSGGRRLLLRRRRRRRR